MAKQTFSVRETLPFSPSDRFTTKYSKVGLKSKNVLLRLRSGELGNFDVVEETHVVRHNVRVLPKEVLRYGSWGDGIERENVVEVEN